MPAVESAPPEDIRRPRWQPAAAITPRALALGVALMIVNSAFLFHSEGMRSAQISNAAPFANVIFLLALLVAVNALLARRLPRLALAVALLATFVIDLASLYHYGAAAQANWALHLGQYTWEQALTSWMQRGPGAQFNAPQWTALGVMAGSFGFCILLMALRYRFLWFPLHPVGMVLGNTTNDVWVAVLLAMVVKAAILRFGGLKGYRGALPFFLGLILGDLTMGMTWIAIGILFNTQSYVFFL